MLTKTKIAFSVIAALALAAVGTVYFSAKTNQKWYTELNKLEPYYIDIVIARYANVATGELNDTTKNFEDSILYQINKPKIKDSCLAKKLGREVIYRVTYHDSMDDMLKVFNNEATFDDVASEAIGRIPDDSRVFKPEYMLFAGGWNPTPERMQKADFSNPYYDSYNVMVSKKGFNSIEDAFEQGVKIAVQSGTIGHDVINQVVKSIPQYKDLVVVTKDFNGQIELINSNKVGVILVDDVVAESMRDSYKVSDSRISNKIINVGTPMAFALSKNSKIKDAINQCMVEMHVGSSPWVQSHYKKKLGSNL